MAAREVAVAIIAAANSLADFPMKGHVGAGNTREWVVPQLHRYLLIYKIEASAGIVHVVSVWHQSRNRK